MLWASFMGKNQNISNTYKTEKGAIMNEGTRNQLEVKLKKMLNQLSVILTYLDNLSTHGDVDLS